MLCRVGDTAPPSRVRLGDLDEYLELIERERAAGDLDADHLARHALALPIDAVADSADAELVLIELAAALHLELALEAVDIPYDHRRAQMPTLAPPQRVREIRKRHVGTGQGGGSGRDRARDRIDDRHGA